MMHALDQLLYQDDLRNFAKDHKELRAKIISMLDFFVNSAPNGMEWPSRSGVRGRRRTYLTILELAHHVAGGSTFITSLF
jgi:hypothetical protein